MSRECIDCGVRLAERNASGRCIPHYRQWMKDAGPTEGMNDQYRHTAEEGSASLLRALRRYAFRHHPDAAWLRVSR